jgi:predicted acyl esterase
LQGTTVRGAAITAYKKIVAADAPLADWMVRLEDVSPDGQVTAITGAGLAGAQRHSMEHPEALDIPRDLQ